MASLLRKYELFIGNIPELDKKLGEPIVSNDTPVKGGVDVRSLPESGKFLKLNEHHFEATVKFPKEGNDAKNPTQVIDIYNPRPETEQRLKTGNIVILKAGYNDQDDLPIIFAAQIIRSAVDKDGPDKIVSIVCGEAYGARRAVRLSQSYPKDFTYLDVLLSLSEIFSSYGVPLGNLKGSEKLNKPINKAYVFSELLTDALDTVCTAIDYKWYLAAGELFIEPKVQSLLDTDFIQVVNVKEENVKDSIEFLDDTSKKDKKEEKEKLTGIRVKLNLNGNIGRGGIIKVLYGQYKGSYLITSVTHKLSYEGSDWDTIVEARG